MNLLAYLAVLVSTLFTGYQAAPYIDYLGSGGGEVLSYLSSPLDLAGSDVTGTLAVANGGTGATTHTSGQLLVGAGSGAITSTSTANLKASLSLNNVENTALSTWAGSTNITTLGTIATGSWSATAIVSSKGGTGIDSSALSGPMSVAAGVWEATTTIGVVYGGTGAATFTNNRVLTGNGTSALVDEANLTFDGSLLTVSGNASTTQLGSTGESYFATSGGNVGVGTTSPSQRLAVQGGGLFSGNLKVAGLTATGSITTALGTPAGTFLAADASGNIIATSSPSGGITGTTYSASSTSYSLSSGTQTFTGSIPATSNLALGSITITQSSDDPDYRDLSFTRSGKTTSVIGIKISGSADDCNYTFTWSGSNLTVEETADAGGNCSAAGTVYWYK